MLTETTEYIEHTERHGVGANYVVQFARRLMIVITFPNRDIEKQAIGFLLGRFSGRILKSGEHIVPEAALDALTAEGIEFSVQGTPTYAQQTAPLRDLATPKT